MRGRLFINNFLGRWVVDVAFQVSSHICAANTTLFTCFATGVAPFLGAGYLSWIAFPTQLAWRTVVPTSSCRCCACYLGRWHQQKEDLES